jgi:tetratricopeptide (TPR) repeat protein
LKPMGTITKYYPFIDDESKSILDSLMEGSSSYYDFVQQLCDVVLEDEVPTNLAYIAAVQAWWCRLEASMKSIHEKYIDVPWIKPWIYYLGSMQRDQISLHDAVVHSIEAAIDSSPGDWIETELHLLHAFFHWPLGDVSSLLEPVEKAKNLIKTQSLLTCFESPICAFEGRAKGNEGNTKDSLVVLQKGKEIAEKNDDALYKYMNMLDEGNTLRCVNAQKASVVFEELYDLAQELEASYFISEVLNDSSIVFETLGEYDLAISCQLEILKVIGDLRPSDTLWILLSRVYATLGDGPQALEWISRGLESSKPFESPTMLLLKAWALALMNRIDESERALDAANRPTIKSGLELVLGAYYHYSGVIEMKKGNLLTALDSLEHAWEVAERNPSGTNQNRVLFDLARVEILIDNQTLDLTKVAVPGRWLSKLEALAVECDLPGVRMYAALLKSEFYRNHGQLIDAQAILADALKITDSPGVKTLRKKINGRIRELNQFLRDAEVSSTRRNE